MMMMSCDADAMMRRKDITGGRQYFRFGLHYTNVFVGDEPKTYRGAATLQYYLSSHENGRHENITMMLDSGPLPCYCRRVDS